MDKSPDAFRTISEVADWLGIPAHVLRFWESKFTHVKPVKRAGGRRYYRPADMQLLGGIKKLLHDDGLTIKGVQKILREQGVGHVSTLSQSLDQPATGSRVAGDGTVLAFKSAKAGKPAPSQPTQIEMLPEPEPEESETPQTPDPVAEGKKPAKTAAKPPVSPRAPSPESPVETAPKEPTAPIAPPVAPSDTKPVLPSFLHRPAAKIPTPKAAEPVPEPTPEPVAVRRPGIVDAPDPVAENDLPYTPGPLAHLAGLHALTPDQARAIAPLARQLRKQIAHTGSL